MARCGDEAANADGDPYLEACAELKGEASRLSYRAASMTSRETAPHTGDTGCTPGDLGGGDVILKGMDRLEAAAARQCGDRAATSQLKSQE